MTNPTTIEDMTCTITGCSNRRSNAGHGRYRKVCERHWHERFGLDYSRTSKREYKKSQLPH